MQSRVRMESRRRPMVRSTLPTAKKEKSGASSIAAKIKCGYRGKDCLQTYPVRQKCCNCGGSLSPHRTNLHTLSADPAEQPAVKTVQPIVDTVRNWLSFM